jgi:3',5'-cyclic AMP phosphodiesterase CpdA
MSLVWRGVKEGGGVMRELGLNPIQEDGELLFRVAHVCDLHLNPSREIPRSRTDSYYADSLRELESLFEALGKEKVSMLAISGDLFNLKNPAKYHAEDYITLSDVFSKGLNERGIKLATIPGNHDLPNSSLDNIDKSPYRVFTRLMGGCDVSTVDTSYLYKAAHGDPFKVSVMVSGVPFLPYEHILGALREHDSKLAGIPNTLHIVLLHPDALPYEEPNYHFQVHTYQEVCDALPHATVLCLGHIHQGYPVYVSKANLEKKRNVQFVSKPFSMGRVVKDYFVSTEILEERHVPSYALIEVRQSKEGKLRVTVEYKAVDHVPFEHAFKREKLQEELERSAVVSSFVENLAKEFGSARNAFEITQTGDQLLASLNVSTEVSALVEEYLNNA